MTKPLPSHAEIVIVGGGVVGASIAYHLTKLGKRDVVLLERKRLTCGTTWHAAGLVGQLRATANLTKLAQYTTGLYAGLEAETGQATGFLQRGSISIATNSERLEELKRGASMAKTFGLEVHEVGRQRNQGEMAAAECRRRRRRRLSAQRRPDQSDRHDDGADQGRDGARRARVREREGDVDKVGRQARAGRRDG